MHFSIFTLALASLLSITNACHLFHETSFTLAGPYMGRCLKLDGLAICNLRVNAVGEGTSVSDGGEGLRRNFGCTLPWFHAWHVEPRDGQLIVAYENDLDGGEFGQVSVQEFKVGVVNGSIRHAALECTLEQNERNPDCILEQNIEGCR